MGPAQPPCNQSAAQLHDVGMGEQTCSPCHAAEPSCTTASSSLYRVEIPIQASTLRLCDTRGSDAYRLRGVVSSAEEVVPWVLDLHARRKVSLAGTITFVPTNLPNKHHESTSALFVSALPSIWPFVNTPYMTPDRQSATASWIRTWFQIWSGMCT